MPIFIRYLLEQYVNIPTGFVLEYTLGTKHCVVALHCSVLVDIGALSSRLTAAHRGCLDRQTFCVLELSLLLSTVAALVS
jgi:hypothetical protein